MEEIMVDKYIKEYKRAVKTLLKLNRLKAAEKRIAITPNKIEEIRLFWIKNAAKGVIAINDVKKEVWKNNDENCGPWNSTIASVMKKKLKMSYRILYNQHPKVTHPDHKALYYQSVLIQLLLKSDSFELIYVDEFSISGRN